MKSRYALILVQFLFSTMAYARETSAPNTEPSKYSFQEMVCQGTLANRAPSDGWDQIAIRIVYGPHEVTDILGQKRTFDLSWRYSFGRTAAEALKKVSNPNGPSVDFESPGLTQQLRDGMVVVSFVDHHYNEESFHVVLDSSNEGEDRFTGFFVDPASFPPETGTYNVQCVAKK